MLQYVNGFSCAMDSEKDELIIKLLQRSPDFTDDNDGVIMDEVATIVMGKVTAQRLLEGLKRNARRWGRLIVTIIKKHDSKADHIVVWPHYILHP